MKFPMENGIVTVKSNQRNAREYYSNSIRKAEPSDINVILMDIDMDDNHEQWLNPKHR